VSGWATRIQIVRVKLEPGPFPGKLGLNESTYDGASNLPAKEEDKFTGSIISESVFHKMRSICDRIARNITERFN
jgi:hypothetical protein